MRPTLGDHLADHRDDPALALLVGGETVLVGGRATSSQPSPGDPPSLGVATAWAPRLPATIRQFDYEGTAYEVPATALVAPDLPATGRPVLATAFEPAWDAATHRRKVDDIRARITAGDCYQVNLAVPFTATLASGDDLAVFTTLLAASPAPFAALIRRPGRPTVVSHSPESFLGWDRGLVTSSPIKGTRRRIPGQETAVRQDLLAAEKDRAELAMIVDLVRNDLGRFAVPGSVQVREPARLMDLTYVHHLVADITARERPGVTLADRLSAAFPAGSITGAPKRMAMAIIHALEGRPRGAYCGAFGWTGDQAGQLAVAIRTAEISGDRITLWSGSGITADSDGAAEWDEVRAKAAGWAQALGGTV